ncbi:hypothetical protein GFK88_29905 (plasmid) [Roseibium aggregatum]|nr:hypothetical protein GFK88_29905 [Roseibium aggregatum]
MIEIGNLRAKVFFVHTCHPLIFYLNPSLRIVSNYSLDRCLKIFENEVMEPGDDLLLLIRVDPGRNMNRVYGNRPIFCGF